MSEQDYRDLIIQMVQEIKGLHTLICIYSYIKVKHDKEGQLRE